MTGTLGTCVCFLRYLLMRYFEFIYLYIFFVDEVRLGPVLIFFFNKIFSYFIEVGAGYIFCFRQKTISTFIVQGKNLAIKTEGGRFVILKPVVRSSSVKCARFSDDMLLFLCKQSTSLCLKRT